MTEDIINDTKNLLNKQNTIFNNLSKYTVTTGIMEFPLTNQDHSHIIFSHRLFHI